MPMHVMNMTMYASDYDTFLRVNLHPITVNSPPIAVNSHPITVYSHDVLHTLALVSVALALASAACTSARSAASLATSASLTCSWVARVASSAPCWREAEAEVACWASKWTSNSSTRRIACTRGHNPQREHW